MKMKFKFPKLKIRKRKKLRAAALRRPLRAAAVDYEEMAEPNMKLSRALFIVLILHVVAVSGIIAFNAIKTRQGSLPAPAQTSVPPATVKAEATAAPVEIKRAHAVPKSSDDSHKTYTVAKGDNPVTIAKKLKVSYDDLIALNHVDDPRKLKIGQKLLIPNKMAKGKKADE